MGRKIEMSSGQLAVTVTPERAASLLFTEGYLNTYYSFVIPFKSADVKQLQDLKGKKISVSRGSDYDKWLQENASRWGHKAESFATEADALQALISGRVNIYMSGNTVAAHSVLKARDKIKVSSLKIDEGLVLAAAFRKGDAALRNQVEDALECLKLDGTLSRLHEKWFGVRPVAGSAAVTVFPGYGVPGLPGHDPKPHQPVCK
jgi:polar amino acid transport system substrate-binding protein